MVADIAGLENAVARAASFTPGKRARNLGIAAPARGHADGGVFAITIPPAPFRCPPARTSALASLPII